MKTDNLIVVMLNGTPDKVFVVDKSLVHGRKNQYIEYNNGVKNIKLPLTPECVIKVDPISTCALLNYIKENIDFSGVSWDSCGTRSIELEDRVFWQSAWGNNSWFVMGVANK